MLGYRECGSKAAKELQKCVGKSHLETLPGRSLSSTACWEYPWKLLSVHVLTNLSMILLLEVVMAVWMQPKCLVRYVVPFFKLSKNKHFQCFWMEDSAGHLNILK